MLSQYFRSSGRPLAPIRKPSCPKCGGHLSLVRIPGPSASDIGMFDCACCDRIHAGAVEADPMRSAAVLWLASHDLRSPT